MASTQQMIDAVREHAEKHYNDGGWDVIVECYDDEAITELIGRARTEQGAIRKAAEIVSVFAERQADAVISAGEEKAPESMDARVERYRALGYAYDEAYEMAAS